MKKTILSPVFFLIFTCNYAQLKPRDGSSTMAPHEELLLKSKKFTTAGWICLGSGTAFVIAGLVSFPKDYYLFYESETRDNQATFSTILILAGSAAMIASIPMFANGALYNHKAKLSIQNAALPGNIPIKSGNNITALSLKISLGKDH
jgi:hypothetical protein